MSERFSVKVAVFLILTRQAVSGETEILLQKRCNTKYMDDKYDMACSGHLEPNESMSMAVVREAKEELGIEIDEKDLVMVCIIHPFQEGYLNVFFTTSKYKGIPQIMEKEKCSDLSWFNIDELPENTIERIRNVVDCLKKKINYDDGDFSHLKSE